MRDRAPIPLLAAWLVVPFVAGGVAAQEAPAERMDAEAAVSAVMDDFHEAASAADFERYFEHFAEGAVFLGTDASERWTLEEFRAYAEPRFDEGRGWTYVPTVRHVEVASGGGVAWFDELLDNATFGVTRGSGVLVREDGEWRVAQYHLTIPIPNALAREVAEMIRARPGGG